jgi:hypothetical protein
VQYAAGTLGIGSLEVATSNMYDVNRDFEPDNASDDERDDADQYEHYQNGHYPDPEGYGVQGQAEQ